MGWHWSIRLCKFQVYTSMTHSWATLVLYYVPTMLPSGNCHTIVCLWAFVYLFLFICCFHFNLIPHMCEIIWVTFSVWLICLAWYSQSPSMSKMVVSHLYVWVALHYIYVPILYSIIYQRTVQSFPCLGHCD